MNDGGWVLFVEGKGDQRFLECLLGHLGVARVWVKHIGGGPSALGKVAEQVRRAVDGGHRVALVVDANSDPAEQRQRLQNVIADRSLDIRRTFLIPNDRGPGTLETLLEGIAAENRRVVYDCLDQYQACLRGADLLELGQRVPDPKGRVYAYCQAVGSETRQEKRDYADLRHWNLDAPVLEPLKRFLANLNA